MLQRCANSIGLSGYFLNLLAPRRPRYGWVDKRADAHGVGKLWRFNMTRRRNIMLGGGALAVAGMGIGYAVLRDMGSLDDYEAAVATTRATLRQVPEIGDLLRYASLAPSGHNTQPWKFQADGRRIVILPDFAQRTPIVDPDDHHLYVSLGCAAENLALSCAARGSQASFVLIRQMEAVSPSRWETAPRSPPLCSRRSRGVNLRAANMTASRSATPICRH